MPNYLLKKIMGNNSKKKSNNCFNLINTSYLQVKQMLDARLRRPDKKGGKRMNTGVIIKYRNFGFNVMLGVNFL